jgi:hypothetical protein
MDTSPAPIGISYQQALGLSPIAFPSKTALEKMRKSQEFLNRLGDAEQAVSPSSLGASSKDQLLNAVLEGHHTEAPLYASEDS